MVARLAQVHRQFVAVLEQVGVDATGVDLEGLFDPWRGIFIQHRRTLLEVDGTHETVDVQGARTDHLGQTAFGHQAHADHLAEAVTGMHIANAEDGVVKAAALDQRHAEGVAADAHAFRQTLNFHRALHGRDAVAVLVVEEGLAAGQSQQPGKGRAQGQAGQGTKQAREHVRAPGAIK